MEVDDSVEEKVTEEKGEIVDENHKNNDNEQEENKTNDTNDKDEEVPEEENGKTNNHISQVCL